MALADRFGQRVVTLCALYFAQGLPWGFMTIALISFLTSRGVGESEAGELAAIVLLPWTFKLVWAPLIDTVTIRSMGRRRPWIIGAELMMAVTMLGLILMGDLTHDLKLLGWMFFIHNCFASLQDVSTDALAVDVLPRSEHGRVNGFMWGSKLVGKGAGAAVMAQVMAAWGLSAAVLLQFILLLVIMLVPLMVLERAGEKRFPWSAGGADKTGQEASLCNPLEVLKDLARGFALQATLAFAVVGTVKTIGHGLAEIVSKTLYTQQLGWSFVELSVFMGYAVIPEFIGAVGGGFLADRFGRRYLLTISLVCYAAFTIAFGSFPNLWTETWFATLYLVLYPGIFAVVTVSYLSLSMRISWTRSTATMFTTYMTLSNVGHVIGNWLAGPVRGSFSFEASFVLAGVLTLVTLLPLMMVKPRQVDEQRAADSST